MSLLLGESTSYKLLRELLLKALAKIYVSMVSTLAYTLQGSFFGDATNLQAFTSYLKVIKLWNVFSKKMSLRELFEFYLIT